MSPESQDGNSTAAEKLGQSITDAVTSVTDAVTNKLSLGNDQQQSTGIPAQSLEGTTEHKVAESVGMAGMTAHNMAGSDAMTHMLHNEGSEHEQECMLFPTYGVPTIIDGQPHWSISISGWLYADPPQSRLETVLMAAVRRVAHVTSNSEQDKRLRERSDMFFTTTVRNMEAAVRTVGFVPAQGQAYKSEGPEFGQELITEFEAEVKVNSGESGTFESQITLKADHVHAEPNKVFKLQTIYDHLTVPSYGVVDLIPEKGVSVISDIDDTIKITNIPDGKEVIMEYTFLKETEQVDGMAELYQKWAGLGAHVHYVSNGPWQLFPMLENFFAKYDFPPGSAHLRFIDRSDVLSTIRGKPGAHKLEAIPKIMKDFPNRKFILIGDTGELDPEVYQKIYQQFPDQVAKVLIHDVTSERALKADQEAEARKAEASKPGKKAYLTSLREAIGLHATVTGQASIASSAVDAVTSTECPDEQVVATDPTVPVPTKVELFVKRIAQVSEGMRPGVFRLYKDAKEIFDDEVVAAAFKENQ